MGKGLRFLQEGPAGVRMGVGDGHNRENVGRKTRALWVAQGRSSRWATGPRSAVAWRNADSWPREPPCRPWRQDWHLQWVLPSAHVDMQESCD